MLHTEAQSICKAVTLVLGNDAERMMQMACALATEFRQWEWVVTEANNRRTLEVANFLERRD